MINIGANFEEENLLVRTGFDERYGGISTSGHYYERKLGVEYELMEGSHRRSTNHMRPKTA